MARVDGETLLELFSRRLADSGDAPALYLPHGDGWRPLTWSELGDRVFRTAAALKKLGVSPGERVVQLSENRPEWIVADLAIQFAGAVHVPIHSTLAGPQVVEQVRDCGARILLVSTAAQAEKLSCAAALCNAIEVRSYEPACDAIHDRTIHLLSELVGDVSDAEAADVHRHALSTIGPDDLATLIYTSGTTGEPRGVMLTQRNLTTNALASLAMFDFASDDLRVGLLPLSHIYARTCDLYCWIGCGYQFALARSRETSVADCLALRPTGINAVPYFYEKVLRASQELGRPLGELLGGRVRLCNSGGAALPNHVAEAFFAAGLPLMQGYGLTETSPVITLSTPTAHKLGAVGRTIADVEIRIADDGEILTRGPHVMRGYWNRPAATADVLKDGWFYTGDLGKIDADGYLTITGRKKEIIVLASGKNIAPVQLEALLTEDPLIDQAVVVGDGRSYLVALLVVNQNESAAPGEKNNATGGDLLTELADRVARRLAGVSHHEQVRRFAVLDSPFSIEGGELTPTLKLRRGVIEEKYADTIAAMYASASHRESHATTAASSTKP
ncbi:MAG: AMP-dependent synthetase/ligase [Pirellulales bacterium]